MALQSRLKYRGEACQRRAILKEGRSINPIRVFKFMLQKVIAETSRLS